MLAYGLTRVSDISKVPALVFSSEKSGLSARQNFAFSEPSNFASAIYFEKHQTLLFE